MSYDVSKVCLACGAQVGERCRTASGKVTDTHYARLSGQVTPRNQLRPLRPRHKR